MEYAELQVTSNFSFLRGGSHPGELVDRAVALGYRAIAVTDRNTMAGIVRAYAAARGKPIQFIPACRLDLLDGPGLLAYPTGREAYGNLSSLLSEGNLRAEKGDCLLYKADVYRYVTGIRFVAVPPHVLDSEFNFDSSFIAALEEYKNALGDSLYLGAPFLYSGDDQKKLFRLSQLSTRLGIGIAT